MHKTLFASILAATLGLAGSASAADLHTASLKDPVAMPVNSWTGFYAGVQGGYGGGKSEWSNIVVPTDDGQNLADIFARPEFQAGLGGVHAGYNLQSGNAVFGINGAINFTDIGGSETCFGGYGDYSASCTNKIDYIADFTGRLGYTPLPNVLVYAMGGAAYISGSVQPTNQTGPGAGYESSSIDEWTYVVGGGLDVAINARWIFGVEYKYYGDFKKNVSFTSNDPENEYSPNFSADVAVKDLQSVTAKLAYKMGGDAVPLR
jgi:outer membrane immunogenic protein